MKYIHMYVCITHTYSFKGKLKGNSPKLLLICRRDEKRDLLCAWSNMKLTHSLRVEQKKKGTPKKHSPTLTEAHTHIDKHRHSRLRSSDAIFQAVKQKLSSKCFAQWLHVCLSLFVRLFVCVRVSLCVCVCRFEAHAWAV